MNSSHKQHSTKGGRTKTGKTKNYGVDPIDCSIAIVITPEGSAL